eukprot:344354-Prymnesium_polylepis.1
MLKVFSLAARGDVRDAECGIKAGFDGRLDHLERVVLTQAIQAKHAALGRRDLRRGHGDVLHVDDHVGRLHAAALVDPVHGGHGLACRVERRAGGRVLQLVLRQRVVREDHGRKALAIAELAAGEADLGGRFGDDRVAHVGLALIPGPVHAAGPRFVECRLRDEAALDDAAFDLATLLALCVPSTAACGL